MGGFFTGNWACATSSRPGSAPGEHQTEFLKLTAKPGRQSGIYLGDEMYSTTDFRKGLKIEVEGTPYEIVEFQHFKPGKGGAMVRTKLRNILTGRIQDITFRAGEKVEKPDLETRNMQFLYRDGDSLAFMDLTSFEQLDLDAGSSQGKEGFLKDGQECKVLLYQGKPLEIDIPAGLVLEVSETEPGAKGDTVSNVTKPAKLETGLVIQVPIFINVGDRVKVDTRTREYLGRE